MKANITDTPLCDLVLVVDGGEGDTLDLGGRAKRATHCTKLCLGGREGRKGNLQGQGYVCGVISEPTLGGYPGVYRTNPIQIVEDKWPNCSLLI